jgi:hypothetical protein
MFSINLVKFKNFDFSKNKIFQHVRLFWNMGSNIEILLACCGIFLADIGDGRLVFICLDIF